MALSIIQAATVQKVNSTTSITVSYVLPGTKETKTAVILFAGLQGPKANGRDRIDSYFYFGREWLREKLIGRFVSFQIVRELPAANESENIYIAYVYVAKSLVNEAVVRAGWALVADRTLTQYQKLLEENEKVEKVENEVEIGSKEEKPKQEKVSSIINYVDPAQLDEKIIKAYKLAKAEKLVLHNTNSPYSIAPKIIEMFGDEAPKRCEAFQQKFLNKFVYGYIETSKLSETGTLVVSVNRNNTNAMYKRMANLEKSNAPLKSIEQEIIYKGVVTPIGLRVASKTSGEFSQCLDEVAAFGNKFIHRTVRVKPISLQGPTTVACVIEIYDNHNDTWADLGLELTQLGYAKTVRWQLDSVPSTVMSRKDEIYAAETVAKKEGKGVWKFLGVSDKCKEATAEAVARNEAEEARVIRAGSVVTGIVIDVPTSDSIVVKDAEDNEYRMWLASCHVPRFNSLSNVSELWGYEARELLRTLVMNKKVKAIVDFIRINTTNNNDQTEDDNNEKSESDVKLQTQMPPRIMATIRIEKQETTINSLMIASGYAKLALVSRYDENRSSDFMKMQAISSYCSTRQIGVYSQPNKKDLTKLIVPKFVDISRMTQKEIISKAVLMAASETRGFVEGVYTGGKMRVLLRPTFNKINNVIVKANKLIQTLDTKLGISKPKQVTHNSNGDIIFNSSQNKDVQPIMTINELKSMNFAPQNLIITLVGITGARVPSAKRNEPLGKEAMNFLKEKLLLTECDLLFTGAVEKMSGAMMAVIKPVHRVSNEESDMAKALIKRGFAEKMNPIPLLLSGEKAEAVISVDNCVPQTYYKELREIEEASQAARVGLFAFKDPASNAKKTYQKVFTANGNSIIEIGYKYGSLLVQLTQEEKDEITKNVAEIDRDNEILREQIQRSLGSFENMVSCDIYGLNADINGTVTFRSLSAEKPIITQRMLDEAGATKIQRVFRNQLVAFKRDDGTYVRASVCEIKGKANNIEVKDKNDEQIDEQMVTLYLTDEGTMYDGGKKVPISRLFAPLPTKMAEIPPSVVRAKLALINTMDFVTYESGKNAGHGKDSVDKLRANYLDEMIDCFAKKTLKVWMCGVHFDHQIKENLLNIIVYAKEDHDLIQPIAECYESDEDYEDAFIEFTESSLNYYIVEEGLCRAEDIESLPDEAKATCEEYAKAENKAVRDAIGIWSASN